MTGDFDAHTFIQWCITHPHEKAPSHTIGDLFAMKAHALLCQECATACEQALKEAPPELPFGKN